MVLNFRAYMYQRNNVDRWLDALIWAVVFFLILMSCCSCSRWSYSREETDPQGNVISSIKAGGSDFLQDSSIDQVTVETMPNGTRKLSIGNVTRDTDEKATKAAVEGVVTGLVKGVVPIP